MSKKLKEILGIIKAKSGETVEEVAAGINYSRGHLSRLANDETGEQDDSEVIALIMGKYGAMLHGVTLGGLPHFTADQLFHMYMKAMERQDNLMDTQTTILKSIESKMATEATQAQMNKKLDDVVSNLADAREVEILSAQHRDKRFEEIRLLIETSVLQKIPPSGDVDNTLDEIDGDGRTPDKRRKKRK